MSDALTKTDEETGADLAMQRGLTGVQKSLLFLVSLDEAVATRVLSHLNDAEVKLLRAAALQLKEVEPTAVSSIHQEFALRMQQGVPTSLKGSSAYLRRLVGKALGEGKAADLWTDEMGARGPVEALSKLEVPTILGVLEREHPQTIALILSLFAPTRAAQILGDMPTERQAEIMMRLAQLQSVPTSVIEDLERQFATEVESFTDAGRYEVEGMEAAVAMLKNMDAERTEALIEELATLDGSVADSLRSSMFTFEDLVRVESRGMQLLLKEVSTEQLVTALKTASEDLKEKVFGSLSARAATVLREELDLLGPVRISDVEEAKQAIVEAALNLEREGRINIAREGEGGYV
ncbi:MAG: flagellar motor switch protein FliG [Myxococcales bacterium]|nr:flagellar motor switch protein FliG [Myxococcales bacterium]